MILSLEIMLYLIKGKVLFSNLEKTSLAPKAVPISAISKATIYLLCFNPKLTYTCCSIPM